MKAVMVIGSLIVSLLFSSCSNESQTRTSMEVQARGGVRSPTNWSPHVSQFLAVQRAFNEVSAISNEASQGNSWKLPSETSKGRSGGNLDKAIMLQKLLMGRGFDSWIVVGKINGEDVHFHGWNECDIAETNYLIDSANNVLEPRSNFTNTYVQPAMNQGQSIGFSNRLEAFKLRVQAAGGDLPYADRIRFPEVE